MDNVTTVTVTDLTALTDLYTAINANVIALVGLLVTIFGGAIGVNIWKNTTDKKEIEHKLSELKSDLHKSYSERMMEMEKKHEDKISEIQGQETKRNNQMEQIKLDLSNEISNYKLLIERDLFTMMAQNHELHGNHANAIKYLLLAVDSAIKYPESIELFNTLNTLNQILAEQLENAVYHDNESIKNWINTLNNHEQSLRFKMFHNKDDINRTIKEIIEKFHQLEKEMPQE